MCQKQHFNKQKCANSGVTLDFSAVTAKKWKNTGEVVSWIRLLIKSVLRSSILRTLVSHLLVLQDVIGSYKAITLLVAVETIRDYLENKEIDKRPAYYLHSA